MNIQASRRGAREDVPDDTNTDHVTVRLSSNLILKWHLLPCVSQKNSMLLGIHYDYSVHNRAIFSRR